MSDELAELKARYDRLNLLYQVGNVIHSTLDPQEALRLILDQAVRLMRASSGSVVLINPTTGRAGNSCRLTACRPVRLTSSCGSARASPAGWLGTASRRVWGRSHRPALRYAPARKSVLSWLCRLKSTARCAGCSTWIRIGPTRSAPKIRNCWKRWRRPAARVIHNTWLYEQLRLKARLLESLASVSQTINSTLNLDDALSVITREACLLMRSQGVLADVAG